MTHNGCQAMQRAESRGPCPGMRVEGGFVRRWLLRTAVGGTLAIALVGLGLGASMPASADPGLPRIATGWLPYWFTTPKAPQGVANAVANADVLTEVSPFWYSATKGGPAGVTVGFNPGFKDAAANAAWAMAQLRAAGLSVIPAIADGSGKGTMAAVLANPATRSAHVADIVNLVVSNGYDGIDLDYEQFAFADGRSTWAATQPNWTAFVTELGAALKAQGKLLTVTIPGPCSTTNVCGGTNGYWVYDMAGIAPAADRIRIMTYDFHYNAPGAIAPISWVTTTAQYAASIVPPGKVVIGIPAYARSWTLKNGSSFRLSGVCPTSGTAYRQLTAMASTTAAEIGQVLTAVGADPASVQFDAATQESWVEYDKRVTWTDGGGVQQTCVARRVMWWVPPQGVLARTQLVGQFGIGGVAFWTIGGEDPAQWPLVRTYAQQLAPAATAVVLSVPPAVPFGTPAAMTAVVTSAGAPVTGVEAALQFKSPGRDWSNVASAPLGPDGTVAFAPVVSASGQWRVYVPGAPGRAEQASDPQPIQVNSVVTAKPRKVKATKGEVVVVRVLAKPARARQKVVVQVLAKGTWKAVGKARVNAKGVAKVQVTIDKKGPRQYRAMAQSKGGILVGFSEPFTIKGR